MVGSYGISPLRRSKNPQGIIQKTTEFSSQLRNGQPLQRDNAKRMYLTENEIERLVMAAKSVGRHRLRDGFLILFTYRHGLRVSELCDLRWDDIDFKSGLAWIERAKDGICTHHSLAGDEVRLLKRLLAQYKSYPWVFSGEATPQLTEQSIRRIVERAGKVAALPFPTHPHQLRHSCGRALALRGVAPLAIKTYLGHRDIRTTLLYCDLASGQVLDVWGTSAVSRNAIA